MPSKRKTTKKTNKKRTRPKQGKSHPARFVQDRSVKLLHQMFFPLLILVGVLWFLYRSLFNFPVWFDESLGKAIFFGLPVWVYVNVTGFRPIIDTFRLKKFQPGLMKGLAYGGIFGFITIFIRVVLAGRSLQNGLLFFSDQFWWEMLLALLTAFWETVFFFSFVMTVIRDRFKNWSLLKQLVLMMTVFVVFHIPNAFLRFDLGAVIPLLGLLGLFSLGQGLLFAENKNAYLLVLTHTIWGMVFLIYF